MNDAEILDWLEAKHTLHRAVEILYVVDGYEIALTYDGEPLRGMRWKGNTLRDACIIAMKALAYGIRS